MKKEMPDNIEKSQDMRIAVYTRVKDNDTNPTGSLELQKVYYTEMCKSAYGAEPAGFYVDVGLAGRAEFQRLLADCRAGKVDKIITKCVSRISRNLPNVMDTVKELRQLGVSIRFELEGLDTSDNNDTYLNMFISFAEQESKTRKATAKQKWGHRARGERLKAEKTDRSDKK